MLSLSCHLHEHVNFIFRKLLGNWFHNHAEIMMKSHLTMSSNNLVSNVRKKYVSFHFVLLLFKHTVWMKSQHLYAHYIVPLVPEHLANSGKTWPWCLLEPEHCEEFQWSLLQLFSNLQNIQKNTSFNSSQIMQNISQNTY